MKPRKLKPRQLIVIEWDDAWSTSNGWEDMDHTNANPVHVVTVGFVRKVSPAGVVVAGTMYNSEEQHRSQVIGECFRPWGMITNLRVLG